MFYQLLKMQNNAKNLPASYQISQLQSDASNSSNHRVASYDISHLDVEQYKCKMQNNPNHLASYHDSRLDIAKC